MSIDTSGPVCTIILNGRKSNGLYEPAGPFLRQRIKSGEEKCIRCGCLLTNDEDEGYSMLGFYHGRGPEFPCWLMCEPCGERLVKFAKTGI
jgi:hypothetical protein